nr:unnamed protein product [Digitaria exilis]
MADNRNHLTPTCWWVTMAGFALLTVVNSGLAIYRAKGDLASVLFVVAASYAALLLLFRCLRHYERAPPGSPARRAVWQLTTLLTVTFSPRAGDGHRPMERQMAAALTMVTFGVTTCDTALAIHDARGGGGGLGTAAFVLVAYAALLALTFRFLRAFAARVARP